jgi:predicted acyltransferase
MSIKEWLFTSCFQPVAGSMFGSLFYALFFGLVCLLIGWVLYRKKIFIKI